MLKVSGFYKAYARSTNYAVHDLNLELRAGEIFGFLGPNGAGKTTTIKAITGILPYSQGNIEICGYNIRDNAMQAKRSFGYVSDNHIIYDKLTGREYVNFLANVYRVSLADRKERAEAMLKAFALSDSYDAPIRTYSHGMKQKINIIGATIHNPPLWILDEPMTGLDPQSNYELKELMKRHCALGNTVFFSTHILDVAERVCDRIGIIVKGQLIAVGTMDELRGSRDATLEQIFLGLAGGA
jgi:ABC-2 type transport system ATP-binding protein